MGTELVTLKGIASSGRPCCEEWVTTYYLKTSIDEQQWNYYLDGFNGTKVMQALKFTVHYMNLLGFLPKVYYFLILIYALRYPLLCTLHVFKTHIKSCGAYRLSYRED